MATLIGMMLWQAVHKWKQLPIGETSENGVIEGAFNQAKSIFFTADGNRSYALESVWSRYSSDENQANSGGLRLVYNVPGNKSMILTAASGLVRNNGNTIELGGEVVIQHMLAGATIPETAKTRDLIINVPMKTAETDAHAVIERHNQILTGDGLEIDLRKASMRLLHNVKTQNAN